jgi:SPP1 gp7 family putative phage head morphogenesis protein
MKYLQISDAFAKLPIINKFVNKTPLNALLGNQKKKDVMQLHFVQEFIDKNRKDHQDWRDSMYAADNPFFPRWHQLQDLYQYLRVDAHTHSLIELRKAATLSTRFYIYDSITGEEQPEKTALLQTEWFYNFLSQVLDARAYGYTVQLLRNPATMVFQDIPRRNICLQKDFIQLATYDEQGISFDDPAIANNLIVVKDEYMYGYMNDLAPLILWKINVMMSWAEATEKYGIPPIIATTNKSDDKSLGLIKEMLKTAGESLSAVLPEGTKIEMLNNVEKVDPQKMFDGLVERCNTEISKRIVGGTMVSDNGSSHSQSKTHQSNFDEKIAESDKRKCEFVTTGQLMPMMAKYSYPFTANDRFAFDRSAKLSPTELAKIFEVVSKEFDVDEDWVRKNLQIPITGKKAQQAPSTNFNLATNAMAASLVALGVTLPTYTSTCKHRNFVTASGINDNVLMDLADALINNIWKSESTIVNSILMAIENKGILTNALFEGWGNSRMKLSYDSPDVACLANMEYNLMEFSLAKSKADVLALNQLLINKEKLNITNFKEFEAAAQKHIKQTNKDYLRTEFNHSISVGQNSRAYLQFKSEQDTVTQFVQWQTVGDSHVRASHAALNGKIFNLKENGGLTIVPPKDWGCRCELVQYLGKPPKDLLYTNAQGLEALDIAKGSKWDINRADSQQVFTANEMYLKKSQLTNESGKMTFKEYGLKPIADIEGLPALILDKTINANNVKELFIKENGKGFMGFKDYLSRNYILTEKQFTDHTTGKYIGKDEQRDKLFPFVKDILKNPDEVYFINYSKKQGKEAMQTNYIKHFDNGEMLIVNTQVGSKFVEIKSWYKSKVNEEKLRQGYLIYRNKKS